MIDYYFDKKLEIKAQQTILKQNSIKLMRELKDMKKTTYFNGNEIILDIELQSNANSFGRFSGGIL